VSKELTEPLLLNDNKKVEISQLITKKWQVKH